MKILTFHPHCLSLCPMQNNDVIRSLRYTFDFGDDQMIKIFSLAELEVTRAEVSDWLKRDDDPEAKPISDFKLAVFLNGLINYKRGKKKVLSLFLKADLPTTKSLEK